MKPLEFEVVAATERHTKQPIYGALFEALDRGETVRITANDARVKSIRVRWASLHRGVHLRTTKNGETFVLWVDDETVAS